MSLKNAATLAGSETKNTPRAVALITMLPAPSTTSINTNRPLMDQITDSSLFIKTSCKGSLIPVMSFFLTAWKSTPMSFLTPCKPL